MLLEDAYRECLQSFEELTRFQDFPSRQQPEEQLNRLLSAYTNRLEAADHVRLRREFVGYGALEELLDNTDITEIIIQGHDSIWFEKKSQLQRLEQNFLGPLTYRSFFHRVLDEAGLVLTQSRPCADGKWRSFRLHAISPPLVSQMSLTLRRQRPDSWTLTDLVERGWADAQAITLLRQMMADQKNILVIGETGSGKTSALEALLQEINSSERCLIIEESEEIKLPNFASNRLLTRHDPQNLLPEVTATDLIRQSLRMRPHRLLLGEIRGPEAKDFLLALSTGHRGSLCTLHARDARQAIIRLEMLIQLGAPQWNLESVRKLLSLSLDYICVVTHEKGKRFLKSIDAIQGLETTGLLLENLYLART